MSLRCPPRRHTRPRRTRQRARVLRTYASLPPRLLALTLTLHRPCGEPANELPLPCDEQGERRYGDHDDTGHDDAPPGRFLEAQLRDADLGGAHERLVRDEERPEVLVVGRQEAIDADRGERR